MKIRYIDAIQILDSRGIPTLEVKIVLSDFSSGTFSVPCGKSVGSYEMLELRDNNKNYYFKKSVKNAIEKIQKLSKIICNINFKSQKEFDNFLIKFDGTKNKSNLGTNTILGLSVAYLKACAKSKGIKNQNYIYSILNNEDYIFSKKKSNEFKKEDIFLFSNILNGGVHTNSNLKIQEFMIIPFFEDVNKSIRAVSEIFHELQKILINEKKFLGFGDEGGCSTKINKISDAFNYLEKAIKKAKYKLKSEIVFAIDCASNEFYNKKKYEIENNKLLKSNEMIDYYLKLLKKFPIFSIEDPFYEKDEISWKKFSKEVEKQNQDFVLNSYKTMIVGDDLLATNINNLKNANEKKLCNSILIKINQIGTIYETLEVFKFAKKNNFRTIISHRSGETNDDFIVDLAIALNSAIKLGAPSRGERVAKYNKLLKEFRD